MARYVRVASVSFRGTRLSTPKETVDRNREEIVRLLKRAALEEPDVVCLPECSPMHGLSGAEIVEAAEEVPGPTFEIVSSIAEEHNMYVVLPLIERKNGRVYNSAVFIDRSGGYVGSYHKMYPTISEMEAGITPGTDPVTFKTDFGTVGFAICFDLNFRDVIEGLVGRGAELLFFPSMYPGGLMVRVWSLLYGVYLVSARAGEGSMIVDPLGRVLTVSSEYSWIICKTLNLDYVVAHLDYNHKKFEEIKRKYGSKVEIDITRPEAFFMLTSDTEGITAEDIVREFNLETRDEYYKRSSKLREKHLKTF